MKFFPNTDYNYNLPIAYGTKRNSVQLMINIREISWQFDDIPFNLKINNKSSSLEFQQQSAVVLNRTPLEVIFN